MTLLFGALSSRVEEDVFAGANAFAVQSSTGAWEICQFREAELQGDGSWRLKGLLRGQAGTEAEALAGADPDARFVLLSPAVAQAEFSQNLRGLSFNWSAGPESELPGTENFTEKSLALTTRGLMPLSPVHLRAKTQGADIRLSWIRRTRQGGDTWEGEVPLSEAFERYRVSIFGRRDRSPHRGDDGARLHIRRSRHHDRFQPVRPRCVAHLRRCTTLRRRRRGR